jgi:hypothetical protein
MRYVLNVSGRRTPLPRVPGLARLPGTLLIETLWVILPTALARRRTAFDPKEATLS